MSCAPDTDAFRPGWPLLAGRSPAALPTKAMAFDREAVFIGSFNLDPRSAVINTEAGLYVESPELAERLIAYMATGVVPADSYRVLLDANGRIAWETVSPTCGIFYRSIHNSDIDRLATRARRPRGNRSCGSKYAAHRPQLCEPPLVSGAA
jgi:hypothetical protein